MRTLEKVLLDKYDVQAMLDINERTMDTYLRTGVLPPRVVLSQRKKGWLKEDILRMLSERKENRRETTRPNGNRGRRTSAAKAAQRNGGMAGRRQQA